MINTLIMAAFLAKDDITICNLSIPTSDGLPGAREGNI